MNIVIRNSIVIVTQLFT